MFHQHISRNYITSTVAFTFDKGNIVYHVIDYPFQAGFNNYISVKWMEINSCLECLKTRMQSNWSNIFRVLRLDAHSEFGLAQAASF